MEVPKFLNDLARQLPANLAPFPAEFHKCYEQRLWHQLTQATEAFYDEPSAKPFLKAVFDGFVIHWRSHASPFSYCRLAVKTADSVKDPKEAAHVLEVVKCEFKDKQDPESQAVYVLAAMEHAHYCLALGHLEPAKETVKACKAMIEGLPGLDPSITCAFHRVSGELAKSLGDYTGYYRASIAFLKTGIEDTNAAERAHDIIVAALLSESVFNFNELMLLRDRLHEALMGTEHEPLLSLLAAMNSGNFDAANRLAPFIQRHSQLSAKTAFLEEKLTLMALTASLFHLAKQDRSVSLATIAEQCRTPIESIELVILRALALGIAQGRIDQAKHCFLVDWVQPRVLSMEQLGDLKDAFTVWRESIESTLAFMADQINVY